MKSADSYLVYPMPIISVGRFYLPGLGQVVDGRRRSGVFFFPSFNFIGERKASDSTDLTGTSTVDWALETRTWRRLPDGAFFVPSPNFAKASTGTPARSASLVLDGILYPGDKWEFQLWPPAQALLPVSTWTPISASLRQRLPTAAGA